MKYFKLTLSYDGGKYKGWQKLGQEDAEKTIQGKLEAVLRRCFGHDVEVHGASRTDAGVHARHQVASFKQNTQLPANEIADYLRAYLPEDIAILKLETVGADFHARYQATSKTYHYQILNNKIQDPFLRKYVWHISPKLSVDAMNESLQAVLGSHDFTTFTNAKSKKKSMVRNITKVEAVREGNFVVIKITGDGFLHNMVRKIVGMAVSVGAGELPVDAIYKSLEAKDRSMNSMLAPAQGLFLEKVHYKKD